jgi:hypothetical protein
MVRSGKRDVDVARGHRALGRAEHNAGRFVGNNARLILDVVSLDADDFCGMEHKAVAISSAVRGRDGRCATGTLINDDVRASRGVID